MLLVPFKWIVALFFGWSNRLFGDPGWAVVGMSVLLSLLLTPLYVWIERRKNADKVKSAPMQAEIDKIEAVYKGRERFYYTREIQRRYKYSPWSAMIPTLGLLVQIPFLLAAYQYLSELPVFHGASFWYIKDISKPDTIARIAGFPVNLLAILMTVINLVSGWRYAESGKPRERIQYMVVAVVFLFLLYRCAASVMIYWTLSNALSFARSEVFFRKRGIAARGQRNRVSAGDICKWLEFGAVALSCYAVAIAVCIPFFRPENIVEFKKAFLLWRIFAVLVVAATFSMAVSCRLKGTRFSKSQGVCISMAAALLLLKALSKYAELPVDNSPLLGYLVGMYIPFCVCLAAVFLFPAFLNSCIGGSRGNSEVVTDAMLPTIAAGCIAAQLAFCGPIVVYASFPDGVRSGVIPSLLCYAFAGLTIFPIAVRLLIALTHGALREILSMLFVFLFVIVFAYGNLFPSDYGVLFGGVYSKPENMAPSAKMVLLESLLIVIAGLALWKSWGWLRRNVRAVKGVLVLVLASYVLRVAIAVFRIWSGGQSAVAKDRDTGDRLRYGFSDSGTNTVYLLLDSVVGQTFGRIAESDPLIAKEFDGFTWYPNTISSGTCTYPNLPAMWGGEEYFPYAIGKSRKLKDVFTEAFDKYKTAVLLRGYDFGCTQAYEGLDVSMDGVSRRWLELNYSRGNAECGTDGCREEAVALKFNAILCAVPTAFRRGIYDDGKWHQKTIERSQLARSFDFLEDLPLLSRKIHGEGMFYHHIHSEATHAPYLTRVGGVEKPCGVVSSFRWSLVAIAKWLRWMKENGVYDNTRIVVCSDHGVDIDDSSLMDARYVRNIDRMKKVGRKRSIYFALLLVKDFGERRKLRVDTSTKTVAHAAYFALGNPRFSAPVKRICPSPVSLHMPKGWRDQRGFKPRYAFEIVGDASDGNNWRALDK